MGRPKGSKNKPKRFDTNTFGVKIMLDKRIENTPITKTSNQGWVNFGSKNDYPQQLSSLFYTSPTLRRCCEFYATSVLGEGIDYTQLKLDDTQLQPNYHQTWEDFIYSIALDYAIYGSYSFQIIKNKDGKTYSVYHQPIADVRMGEYDEDGVITECFISKDWTNRVKYPPIKIKRFGFQDDEEIKSGEPYLFVFQRYCPDSLYYWQPTWVSAIKAVQTESELLNYDFKSTLNGFNASGILTLDRVDSEEERNNIINNITNLFSGTDNANSLIVSFRNNIDDKAPEFTPFTKNMADVDLFANTNERAIERIITAFGIPSKQLIGYSKEGSQLGGNSNEMAVAFNLFNQLVGNKLRKDIVGIINKIFRLNGIEMEITLKPLNFYIEEKVVDENINVSTTEEDKEITDNNNIKEQV